MSSITLHPNHYDWFYPDYTMKYAQKAGMAVQGTPLVYPMPATLPEWVKQLEVKQAWEPLRVAMKNQIASVVGHYRGKVRSWSVVNEAVDYEATTNGWGLSRNLWQKAFAQNGKPEAEYIEEAFTTARNADREAVLIYNDFANSEINGKSDFIYSLLKGLKSRKVPVDAVGFQMHSSKERGRWLVGARDH